MVISGYIKSKQKTLIWQTIQIGLMVVSNLVLGAYTGVITNAISVPRNILAYKEKLNWYFKILIIASITGFSILFNKNGLIGLAPLLATIPYTILMDKLKPIAFKVLIIYTLIFWLIYDFYVQNYVSAAFDFGTIITSFIAIIRLNKEKNL